MGLASLVLGLWVAQAEPAPTTAPTAAPAPPTPSHTLSVLVGLGYRLGSEGSRLGPAAGFSLGGGFQHRYLTVASALELGVALDFLFDRFSQGVEGSIMTLPGVEEPVSGDRLITQTNFVALQTAGAQVGALHFWGGAGGGLSIAFFSSPEQALRPGSTSSVQPVARGVLGIDVAIKDSTALGVRASYSRMITHPTYTTETGDTLRIFGDLLDIHAGLFYRF
jgi:hypothetical protein